MIYNNAPFPIVTVTLAIRTFIIPEIFKLKLIIDELGYVPFTKIGSELLFQFFVSRYERASVMITTNLEFTDWTSIFGDEKMTSALLDRLTQRAHIFLLNGGSYRFRQSMKKRGEIDQ
ncbi:ATP-binding protein [Neobacillus drentensis]|jgi:DNA replication protein DnaC|uniref:ATP-binding protein n=1 Tax=Neobacillus drentensis TaxID=220684 RepID=UPI003B586969